MIRFKSIGVALLDVTELGGRDDYLAKYAQARRMERKARKAGYTVRPFEPEANRDDLHAIHTSSSTRQGRSMEEAYLSESHVYKRTPGDVYLGAYHGETIIAYLYLMTVGDIGMVSRHICHADHLREGAMYMLTAEAVEHLKAHTPNARFLMHDTFFGAAAGLRFFKQKNGFVPYRVRWLRDVGG